MSSLPNNGPLISFVSNPQFWATVRAVHNHMLADRLDDWGVKRITRLGEILEGNYSDHLTPQHKQDEIDFTNKLEDFVRRINGSVNVPAGYFDIHTLTYMLNQQDRSAFTLDEKEFMDSLDNYIKAKVNEAVQQTINSLKIVKEDQ